MTDNTVSAYLHFKKMRALMLHLQLFQRRAAMESLRAPRRNACSEFPPMRILFAAARRRLPLTDHCVGAASHDIRFCADDGRCAIGTRRSAANPVPRFDAFLLFPLQKFSISFAG